MGTSPYGMRFNHRLGVVQTTQDGATWSILPASGPWTVVNHGQSPYTVTSAARRLLVDTSAGNVQLNFPAALGILGIDWEVMKSTGDANTVTLTPNGADTIQDDASEVLNQKYASMKISAIAAGKWAIL
jgi:hypothetical protein